MSGKNISIKNDGAWYCYNWEPSSGNFYKVSGGFFSNNYSKMGNASSLQDAISLAKADCDADKYATVEVKEG